MENPMLSAQRAGRSPTDKQKMPDGGSSRTDKEIVKPYQLPNGRSWREAVIRQKEAQTERVAKAPILSDRRAGTAETVPLDEDHGLRISIRGHPGSWPVST